MLIKNTNAIIQSLKLDLFFEDNIEKHFILDLGDIVTIKYNKNGLLKEVTGKIVKIDSNGSFITIDGSQLYSCNAACFKFDTIVDCTMITKYRPVIGEVDTEDVVYATVFRIYKGQLQYLYNDEWFNVVPDEVEEEPVVSDTPVVEDPVVSDTPTEDEPVEDTPVVSDPPVEEEQPVVSDTPTEDEPAQEEPVVSDPPVDEEPTETTSDIVSDII